MHFVSLDFLVFCGLFFALWKFLKPNVQVRWLLLTTASFIFYGWWNWHFLLLIVASGLIDFLAALGIQRYPTYQKFLLILSLASNLSSLAVFKYLAFFITSTNSLATSVGYDVGIPLVSLTLPVGISFYTFQSMSYTIDVYRGKLEPTRNVLHFFAYLSMFPQLVAGPIVRASDLLPSLREVHVPSSEQRWAGFRLICFGYFKKMVIADQFAPAVNSVFSAPVMTTSSPVLWTIMIMFAIQIYCDFSGYTDIARGLAKWMGYDFPVNFNRPYEAVSMQDFWRRWHISLSSWFRDYVYFPLGGSRGSEFKAHQNAWITMLLSGLWHGAAWTFIAWGAVHAACLSFERVTDWPRKLSAWRGGTIICRVVTFLLVLVGWVFFRAETFTQAVSALAIMVRFNTEHLDQLSKTVGQSAFDILLLTLAYGLMRSLSTAQTFERFRVPLLHRLEPVGVAVIITSTVFLRGPGHSFVYFQF